MPDEQVVMTEVVEKPTPEGVAAAEKTLKQLRQRSFSERHPELGKMINCQVCQLRHRTGERNCQQTFAKRWIVDNDGKKVYISELLIAGVTPETETVIEEKKVRREYGAKVFSHKRHHPHSNRRRPALENRFHSKLNETRKRFAKPTDVWPSDPKVINDQGSEKASPESTGAVNSGISGEVTTTTPS